MKKILLFLICSMAILSCTNNKSWTQQQKDQFKERIKIVKGLDYLKNMTDEEFAKFATDVTTSVESLYPDYAVFVEIPSVDDTISTFVVHQFANVLESDYRTLHNLYPYHQLVQQGLLPEGLTKEAKEAFYACLASKIRAKYENMGFFLGALTYGNEATIQVKIFQMQCAMELGASVMIEEQIVN